MPEVIAGLEIPGTAAVAEATRHIQETTSPLIYHHSRRVFFFSLIHAHKLGVKPDPELLYLAAMFHDTGLLTPFSDVEQRFEVDGADHARRFLLDLGFPAAAAETVWTAIALHTTPGIPGRMAPEIATTHLGVLTDVLGFGLDGLETDQLGEILAVHPRGDFKNEFLRPSSTGSRIARNHERHRELRCARALHPRLPAHDDRRAHRRLALAELTGHAMNGVSRLDNGRRLGRCASFVLLVCANVLMMATASAPSPIYSLYQERWGFSVTMLTVIFAVYVAGLLGALLTVGSLSDHLGHRPVLIAALLMAAAGTAIFWTADGVGSLLIARVVQGLATGTATGALAAGLVEFAPNERPHLGPTMTAVGTSAGMAIGAGVVGLLVQVTTRPDAYVFPLLTLAFVTLAVVVVAIPEPPTRRAGGLASLRPRVRVPWEARPELLATIPAIVAGWSVTGLFLALTPSLVTTVLHVGFGAAGGLSIAVLFLANSAGGVWAVRHTPWGATSLGAVCLALGSAGLAVALVLTSVIVFVIGSVIAGLGVGLTFSGTLRVISAATSAKTRSEVFSAAYVISYTALSVPSLAAGLLARWWGLEATAYLYIASVAVLSVIAAVHAGRPQAHQRTDDGRSATSAAGRRHHAWTPC